jgi:uncharacterized protein (TIGR02001 family)
MRKMMMKQALLATAALGVAGLAHAELTANVGVTSNYVFRGETQTDDGLALQGGVDFTHDSGIFAGIWASNVEFGDDKGYEYDLYAGYNFKVNDKVTFDIGYITYQYASIDGDPEADEIFVGASFYDFSATYYDGNLDAGPDYAYIDLKYTLAMPQDFNIHFHYGFKDSDNSYFDAEDASIGVSKEVAGFDLSLTWTTIDYDDSSRSDEDELFVTVTKNFDLMK